MKKDLKPKVVHIHNGILYDSREEILVAMWLDELVKFKYVDHWYRNTEPLQMTDGFKISYTKETKLKTKTKYESKQFTALRPSVYTTDFIVKWTNIAEKVFFLNYDTPERFMIDPKGFILADTRNISWIEVKPEFDQNNMTREFKLNQKFIWNKYKIFINLIEPKDLFKRTFMPIQARTDFVYKVGNKKKGKVKGDWTVDYIPQQLEQFLFLNT